MEPRKTSFIPKKMYVDTSMPKTAGTVSVFSIISIVVFLITLSLSVGVFFYQKMLVGRLDALNAQLVKEKNSFEPATVEEAVRLSRRIESVKTILDNHIVVHPIFELLSEKTLKNVQFTSFTYDFIGGDSGVSVSMKGTARGWEAVALQSDIFGNDKKFNNPVFDSLTLDKSGNISFNFSTSFPSDFVSFKNAIQSGVTAAVEQ